MNGHEITAISRSSGSSCCQVLHILLQSVAHIESPDSKREGHELIGVGSEHLLPIPVGYEYLDRFFISEDPVHGIDLYQELTLFVGNGNMVEV